jgi:hypothetical protein
MASLFLHLANKNNVVESPTLRPQTVSKPIHGANQGHERLVPPFRDTSGPLHKEEWRNDKDGRHKNERGRRSIRTDIGSHSVSQGRVGVSSIYVEEQKPMDSCRKTMPPMNTPDVVGHFSKTRLSRTTEKSKFIESDSNKDNRHAFTRQHSFDGVPVHSQLDLKPAALHRMTQGEICLQGLYLPTAMSQALLRGRWTMLAGS